VASTARAAVCRPESRPWPASTLCARVSSKSPRIRVRAGELAEAAVATVPLRVSSLGIEASLRQVAAGHAGAGRYIPAHGTCGPCHRFRIKPRWSRRSGPWTAPTLRGPIRQGDAAALAQPCCAAERAVELRGRTAHAILRSELRQPSRLVVRASSNRLLGIAVATWPRARAPLPSGRD